MKTTRREALKRAAVVLLAAVVASPAAARPKPVLRCARDNCPMCAAAVRRAILDSAWRSGYNGVAATYDPDYHGMDRA